MKEKNGLRLARRLALGPYGLWSALFILVPLLFVAYYAFTDNNYAFTTANITRFFTATSSVGEGEGAREAGSERLSTILPCT